MSEKTAAEIEYDRLTAFLEKLVRWFLLAITVFGTIFSVLFFKDRQSMMEERTEMQKEYNQKVEKLTHDLENLKSESKSVIESTKNNTQQEIGSLKGFATDEISKIKIKTYDLASQETQKQLSFYFQQDKIQKILEQKVNEELKENIDKVVIDKISSSSTNIVKITNFATTLAVGNYYSTHDIVYPSFDIWVQKEFLEKNDQWIVRDIYYKAMREYDSQYYYTANSLDLKNLNDFDKSIPVGATESEIVKILNSKLRGYENLHSRCLTIKLLNRINKTDCRCFDPCSF